MDTKNKELLLKDLCTRLPYGLYATVRDPEENDDFQPFEILGIKEDLVWVRNTIINIDHFDNIEVIKPHLRPMSSMTEEEQNEFDYLRFRHDEEGWLDFVLSRHLDWRDLIEKGLALEAPEGMYNN